MSIFVFVFLWIFLHVESCLLNVVVHVVLPRSPWLSRQFCFGWHRVLDVRSSCCCHDSIPIAHLLHAVDDHEVLGFSGCIDLSSAHQHDDARCGDSDDGRAQKAGDQE